MKGVDFAAGRARWLVVCIGLWALGALASPLDVSPALPPTFVGPEEGPFEVRFGVDAATSTVQTAVASESATLSSVPLARPSGPNLLSEEGIVERRLQRPRLGELWREARLVENRGFGRLRVVVATRADLMSSRLEEQMIAAMSAERVLVRLRPGIPLDRAEAIVRSLGVLHLRRLGDSRTCVAELAGQSVEAVPDAVAALSRLPMLFEYAEPDQLVELESTTVNDTFFSKLWGFHNTGQTGGLPNADVNAPEAWSIARGDRSILVGVIDTGIDYTHPDLAAQIWINPGEIPGNGIDDDGNGYIDDVHGYNFVDDTGDPFDDHKHGTHVAGTIGAVANNGRGVAGIAHEVTLVAIKFLNVNGSGFTSDAVRAINYATAIGCDITNHSWGGGSDTLSFRIALEDARAAGQIVVVAAGNKSRNLDNFSDYPARYSYDNMIKVAATTHNDRLASFSNYSTRYVDLGAPGDRIFSTMPGGSYGELDGTSMAAPMVSGAMVVLKSHFPELNHDQLINRLLGTVTPLEGLAGRVRTGGRLDLYRALTQPSPDRMILTNTSSETVSWSVFSATPWLKVTPSSGTMGPGAVSSAIVTTLTAAADALATGEHQGSYNLVATSSEGSYTVTRQVALTVEPYTGGQLAVTPADALEASGPAGGPIRPDVSTYQLENPGSYSIEITAGTQASWLRLGWSERTFAPGESRPLAVTVEADDLPIGVYTSTIVLTNVTNGRGSRAIEARLEIIEPGEVTVSPVSRLDASGDVGGPFTPDRRAFTVANNSDSPIDLRVTSSASWLSASLASSRRPAGSTIDVTARINSLATSLSAGTYTASVAFINDSTGVGTTERQVVLTISDPPELAIDPSTNGEISGLTGGPFSPVTLAWTLANTGDRPLEWLASTNVSWLTLSGYQGHLAADGQVTLQASINAAADALSDGTYLARVDLSNITNGSGSGTRFVTLRVLRRAVLSVSPSGGFSTTAMIGRTAANNQQAWQVTNTGTQSMELQVSSNRDWVRLDGYGASASLGLAAGETRTVTAVLDDYGSLDAGNHTATLNFDNQTNGIGSTTRSMHMKLHESAIHAIYSLSLRGGLYGGAVTPIQQGGFAVLERISGQLTLVTAYRDRATGAHVYDVEPVSRDFTMGYTFAVGQRDYEFLTVLDRDGDGSGPSAIETQQLLGAVFDNVPLGGGVIGSLPAQFSGVDYFSSAASGQVRVANILARVQMPRTRAVNSILQSHDDVVASLVTELTAAGLRSAAEGPGGPGITEGGDEAVLLYSAPLGFTQYTGAGRTSLSRSGYLLVDPASQTAAYVAIWREGGRATFATLRWDAADVQVHSVLVNAVNLLVVDVLRQPVAESDAAAVLYRWVGSGPQNPIHVGGGRFSRVAGSMSGHVRLDDAATGSFGAGSMPARLSSSLTISMNERNFSLSDAVDEVESLLMAAGWERSPDGTGLPGE